MMQESTYPRARLWVLTAGMVLADRGAGKERRKGRLGSGTRAVDAEP